MQEEVLLTKIYLYVSTFMEILGHSWTFSDVFFFIFGHLKRDYVIYGWYLKQVSVGVPGTFDNLSAHITNPITSLMLRVNVIVQYFCWIPFPSRAFFLITREINFQQLSSITVQNMIIEIFNSNKRSAIAFLTFGIHRFHLRFFSHVPYHRFLFLFVKVHSMYFE